MESWDGFISYLKIVRRIIWENHINAWNGAYYLINIKISASYTINIIGVK